MIDWSDNKTYCENRFKIWFAVWPARTMCREKRWKCPGLCAAFAAAALLWTAWKDIKYHFLVKSCLLITLIEYLKRKQVQDAQAEKLTSWQTHRLRNWQSDKMYICRVTRWHWQDVKLKILQIDKMTRWQDNHITRWHDDLQGGIVTL